MQKGEICHRLGSLHEALDNFQASLKQRPDWLSLYNNIGVILSELGQKEAALGAYNAGLSIDETIPDRFLTEVMF